MINPAALQMAANLGGEWVKKQPVCALENGVSDFLDVGLVQLASVATLLERKPLFCLEQASTSPVPLPTQGALR